MRYDKCKCTASTNSTFEKWEPFPGTVVRIERCTACKKIKDMRQVLADG